MNQSDLGPNLYQTEGTELKSGAQSEGQNEFEVYPGSEATFMGQSLIAYGAQVLTSEADAIVAMRNRLAPSFEHAIELLLECTGKVVVTGMGKSGHIGTKIAATFASTGTPAFCPSC